MRLDGSNTFARYQHQQKRASEQSSVNVYTTEKQPQTIDDSRLVLTLDVNERMSHCLCKFMFHFLIQRLFWKEMKAFLPQLHATKPSHLMIRNRTFLFLSTHAFTSNRCGKWIEHEWHFTVIHEVQSSRLIRKRLKLKSLVVCINVPILNIQESTNLTRTLSCFPSL